VAKSDTALLPLAESVADGSSVDWQEAEARATTDEQAVIRQLRVLASLAAIHRSLPAASDAEPHTGARRTTSPAIGSWAELSLVERLGGGTFGEVYRAWDRHLEREVALKLLRLDDLSDDPQTSRIAREGRLLARVRHPNVITVHGVEIHEGRIGLCMELVRGTTLEDVLHKRGSFSAREAALVGIDLCHALAAVHGAGLIHRDVKAQNVMREDGGRIVLMDLGTGRESRPDGGFGLPDLAGTPLYLAPEIFDGASASERTDLYSLGVLLYHLVTGSFPVPAATVDELRNAQMRGTQVRLRDARADLPTAFVRVVDRAIARDPSRRYATAGALEADLVDALHQPAAQTPTASGSWRIVASRRTALVGALAAMLLAVATLAWWIAVRRPLPAAGPGPIRSIAVLPLKNLSGDPSQEYFADGMTDELISSLGRLGSFNVISRTSVLPFKDSKKSATEIAAALHVDALLEGSVLVVPGDAGAGAGGQRVRINARLIRAGTDTQLWEKTFERVVSDALALQSEVANAVAAGIDSRVAAERKPSPTARHENFQAQDAYLQGKYLLTDVSRDTLGRAREYLERSVQIDPGYAPAYANLARCYMQMDLFGLLPRPEVVRLARAASTTAAQLDESLPEAQNYSAQFAFHYQWDWAAADRAYRRAIELNPSYSFARTEYARFLMAQGRVDDAVAEARRAVERDPLSAEASSVVGLGLFYARRYDEAIAQYRDAIRLAPRSAQRHLGVGRAYAEKGQFDLAIAELQQAVTLSGQTPFFIAELARTHAVAGHRREAEALMASITKDDGGPRLPAQYRTYMYAALGQPDLAFEWLNKAVDDREPSILWAQVDPRFDSLRQDPRFAAFLRRVVPTP
jgi:eukaryotic-like serine/threonine-protein kinase